MTYNTLLFPLDFDGHLWPHVFDIISDSVPRAPSSLSVAPVKTRTFGINFDNPLVRHIIAQIIEHKPKRVIFCSFSNRQCFESDINNSWSYNSFSSFHGIEIFARAIERVFRRGVESTHIACPDFFIDRYLMVDTAPYIESGTAEVCQSASGPGRHWEIIIASVENSQLPNIQNLKADHVLRYQVTSDPHKLLSFYILTQRHCSALGKGEKLLALFCDDREDILRSILLHFGGALKVLPDNFTFQLWNYNPNISDGDGERWIRPTLLLNHLGDNGFYKGSAPSLNTNWAQFHVGFVSAHKTLVEEMNGFSAVNVRGQGARLFAALQALHCRFTSSKAAATSQKTGLEGCIQLISTLADGMIFNSPVLVDIGRSQPDFLKQGHYVTADKNQAKIQCALLPRVPLFVAKSDTPNFQTSIMPQLNILQLNFNENLKELAKRFSNDILPKLSAHTDADTYLSGYYSFLVKISNYLPITDQVLLDYIYFRTQNFIHFLQLADVSPVTEELNSKTCRFFHSWNEQLKNILSAVFSTAEASALIAAPVLTERLRNIYFQALLKTVDHIRERYVNSSSLFYSERDIYMEIVGSFQFLPQASHQPKCSIYLNHLIKNTDHISTTCPEQDKAAVWREKAGYLLVQTALALYEYNMMNRHNDITLRTSSMWLQITEQLFSSEVVRRFDFAALSPNLFFPQWDSADFASNHDVFSDEAIIKANYSDQTLVIKEQVQLPKLKTMHAELRVFDLRKAFARSSHSNVFQNWACIMNQHARYDLTEMMGRINYVGLHTQTPRDLDRAYNFEQAITYASDDDLASSLHPFIMDSDVCMNNSAVETKQLYLHNLRSYTLLLSNPVQEIAVFIRKSMGTIEIAVLFSFWPSRTPQASSDPTWKSVYKKISNSSNSKVVTFSLTTSDIGRVSQRVLEFVRNVIAPIFTLSVTKNCSLKIQVLANVDEIENSLLLTEYFTLEKGLKLNAREPKLSAIVSDWHGQPNYWIQGKKVNFDHLVDFINTRGINLSLPDLEQNAQKHLKNLLFELFRGHYKRLTESQVMYWAAMLTQDGLGGQLPSQFLLIMKAKLQTLYPNIEIAILKAACQEKRYAIHFSGSQVTMEIDITYAISSLSHDSSINHNVPFRFIVDIASPTLDFIDCRMTRFDFSFNTSLMPLDTKLLIQDLKRAAGLFSRYCNARFLQNMKSQEQLHLEMVQWFDRGGDTDCFRRLISLLTQIKASHIPSDELKKQFVNLLQTWCNKLLMRGFPGLVQFPTLDVDSVAQYYRALSAKVTLRLTSKEIDSFITKVDGFCKNLCFLDKSKIILKPGMPDNDDYQYYLSRQAEHICLALELIIID